MLVYNCGLRFYRAYSRHWGHGCIFSGAYFLKEKKKAFCLLAPPKQMSFLTILMKILFSKLRALDWT